MPVLAPPHLRFAPVGEAVICLDIKADRYVRINGRTAATLRAALDGVVSAADCALLDAGHFRTMSSDGRPLVRAIVELATDQALGASAPFPALPRLACCIAAMAASRIRLKRHGLAHAVARAEHRQRSARTDDPARAKDLATAFEAARPLYPGQRRCLPDSLALQRLLTGHGLRCTLVIGVRDQPFVAHCWVQAGPWLLTDTLDEIAGLTPILAV